MPLTRHIIAERIEALGPELRRIGVSRVALFGSCLRDVATPQSDVDVLVDFKPGRKTFRSLMSLAEMLEFLASAVLRRFTESRTKTAALRTGSGSCS
jgi:predicted nucleotidyltransferase